MCVRVCMWAGWLLGVLWVEVESYNPGPALMLSLRPEWLTLFLSCFPQASQLGDFGVAALPRLRLTGLRGPAAS